MSSAINFSVSADNILARVMETFFDTKNRLVLGPLTVEELLVNLARQPEMVETFANFGVRAHEVEADALSSLLELSTSGPDMVGDMILDASAFPARTSDFEVVINRAILHVQGDGSTRDVTLMDLLVAITSLSVTDSAASRVLHDHGLSEKRMLASLRQSRHQSAPATALGDRRSSPPQAGKSQTAGNPYAQTVARNPSASFPGDPMFYDIKMKSETWIERQNLVEHALQVLSCERGPGLLMVGPQGVGKSALASEIARRLSTARSPLRPLPMLGLDVQVLLAGSQLRGDLERQLLAKTHWLEKQAPHGVILWLHNIGDLLTSRRQGQDIIAPLRSALRGGIIRLMASATPEQAKQLIDTDSTFADHFVTLRTQVPSMEETIRVADLSVPRFAKHHAVAYPASLTAEAVQLVMRHHAKVSPLSPVMRALDEAGALAASQKSSAVTVQHMHTVLARQFGLPANELTQSWGERLETVEKHLHDRVMGQSHAIDAIMLSLRLAQVGLGQGGKTKPIGSFFFAGPTGVGKTELAKQMAEGLGVPLLRLDMSEYHEGHTTSRLIGAPPGYVGYQEGGKLAIPLTQTPRMVVLLDEFEKAAPQVHALFLQVLDYGYLTDGQGHAIDCRQAIFVFTSNVGAQDAARSSIGFVIDAEEGTHRRDQAMKQAFPPEFRNRFDHIIQFNALGREHVIGVVNKMLDQLRQDIAEKGHQLRFTPALRQWLVATGHDPVMGARPLQRLINTQVAAALAKAILAQTRPVICTVGHHRGKLSVKVTARK